MFQRAVEQRLHWAAEAAVLNALAGQFAPWEAIQQPAQAGLVPVTAAAGVCMGWKLVFVGLPRLGRWMVEHGLQFEMRFSIGRRAPNRAPVPGATERDDRAGRAVRP
ncbi:hypothetical protein [Nocardia brasiliensis]|uniref:hypothetical protein n=1 Tax=Nocardia brasiliensis TaxID=37326 RepID=UPI003D93EA3F